MNHSKLLMKSNGIHVYLFHSYSLSCNSISYVGSFNGTFRHWKIKLFQTLVNWVKSIETTPTPPNAITIATTAYFCWLLNSLSFLFWHLILLLLISLLLYYYQIIAFPYLSPTMNSVAACNYLLLLHHHPKHSPIVLSITISFTISLHVCNI